jgi:hypothetical protein
VRKRETHCAGSLEPLQQALRNKPYYLAFARDQRPVSEARGTDQLHHRNDIVDALTISDKGYAATTPH